MNDVFYDCVFVHRAVKSDDMCLLVKRSTVYCTVGPIYLDPLGSRTEGGVLISEVS